MKYHVHFKNESGHDDYATVDADDNTAAEALVMDSHPGAVATIDAYPAWDPTAAQEQGWAR